MAMAMKTDQLLSRSYLNDIQQSRKDLDNLSGSTKRANRIRPEIRQSD